MAFTELDPKTALLVIDLQKGIVGLPLAHPVDEVVANVLALIGAFRRHGLRIVLVNVAGSPPGRTDKGASSRTLPDGWTDLIPELDQQPEDLVVTKHARSAFSDTGTRTSMGSTSLFPSTP
jgi:nicotinamidase-related amidase